MLLCRKLANADPSAKHHTKTPNTPAGSARQAQYTVSSTHTPAAASNATNTSTGHGSGRPSPVGAAAQSMRSWLDNAIGVQITTASSSPTTASRMPMAARTVRECGARRGTAAASARSVVGAVMAATRGRPQHGLTVLCGRTSW